jgi:Amt family ammonium transporter
MGKMLVALSLLTFIALVVVGSHWGSKGGDATGTSTGGITDYQAATGAPTGEVPVSQAGINQLANETGHLRISINFTWTLITGFLVLFMQVGFSFLVTGLTRARNAGHMMMMNIAAFAVAFIAYYAVGFAFHFGGVAPVANLGGLGTLNGLFGIGVNGGLLGTHGFFLQSHGAYDVGVLALFLFEVVFMETAGYIIIGAIAERITFGAFILAELAMGAVIYPIYGN